MSEVGAVDVEIRMDEGSGVMIRWKRNQFYLLVLAYGDGNHYTHRCEEDRFERRWTPAITFSPSFWIIWLHPDRLILDLLRCTRSFNDLADRRY